MEVLPEQFSDRLGSYLGGASRQRDVSKPQGQGPALGGSASMQAATRVNPEQASKGRRWTPTWTDLIRTINVALIAATEEAMANMRRRVVIAS